jgi:bacteriocin-like protein
VPSNFNLKGEEIMNKREELTTDELNLVSGGATGIGIGYGAGSDGTTSINWPDGTGKGYYTMTEGTKGYTWTPYH